MARRPEPLRPARKTTASDPTRDESRSIRYGRRGFSELLIYAVSPNRPILRRYPGYLQSWDTCVLDESGQVAAGTTGTAGAIGRGRCREPRRGPWKPGPARLAGPTRRGLPGVGAASRAAPRSPARLGSPGLPR